MKKPWGINKKILVSIICFTLLLVVLLGASGSLLFDRVIEKQYNDRGYIIAKIISNDIDHDKIAQYTKTWEEDDYYHEMEEYLHHIEEYSGVAYIYIAVPFEDGTFKYVYDTATYIGDSDPIAASFEEIWSAYTTGQRPESYLTRHSKKYGYLTSSCLPIKDSSGQTVALLFVDTNMEDILSVIRSYVTNMVTVSLILLAIFCVVHWYFMKKKLINPLVIIRNHVRNFAQGKPTEGNLMVQIDTKDELEELAKSVDFMEKEINEYIDNIKNITSEKERISTELSLATKIQLSLLPHVFPPFPDRKEFDIYATMEPAREVGGDFYDFFLIDDDHLGLVMADVSGKGIPAALFMMISKIILQSCAMLGKSASETLQKTNEAICSNNQTDMFVTVWFGILEISSGVLTCANAGHEYPVIKRANGEFEIYKDKHGFVIGGMEETVYKEYKIELGAGDKLFVYTDGIPEAIDANNQMFGADRMLDSLNHSKEAFAKEILDNVRSGVADFVKDAEQFDDMTMMCLEYFGHDR